MNVHEKISGTSELKTFREKKSETLEVRLGYLNKNAFMAACKSEGKTASAVIRTFIDGYLAKEKGSFARVIAGHKRKLAAAGAMGLLAFTFASVTAPSSAGANMLMRVMDTNHDGVLSLADETDQNRKALTILVSKMDANADGSVTQAELNDATLSTRLVSYPVAGMAGQERKAMPTFNEVIYYTDTAGTEAESVASDKPGTD